MHMRHINIIMNQEGGLMPTVNIIGTFHMVVYINDGADLDELLFKETEWMGEPTSPNGCVVTMVPKKYEILTRGKNIIPENAPEKKVGSNE